MSSRIDQQLVELSPLFIQTARVAATLTSWLANARQLPSLPAVRFTWHLGHSLGAHNSSFSLLREVGVRRRLELLNDGSRDTRPRWFSSILAKK